MRSVIQKFPSGVDGNKNVVNSSDGNLEGIHGWTSEPRSNSLDYLCTSEVANRCSAQEHGLQIPRRSKQRKATYDRRILAHLMTVRSRQVEGEGKGERRQMRR